MIFRKKKTKSEQNLELKMDKPIEYYIDMLSECGKTEEIGFSLYNNGSFRSSAYVEISAPKKGKLNHIYITSFHTNINYRNNGFGKKVLRYAASKITEINEKLSQKTISVSGNIVPEDLTSWQYSLPMYLKFARNIIGEDIVCLINGNPVENENIVSEAYNLNDKKIAVRFEFRKANIL